VLSSALAEIRKQRVIPVLRSGDADGAIMTGRACQRGGMKVIELTCSTPGFERAIDTLSSEGMVVGLGTVTTSRQVSRAATAGAQFVVSFGAPWAALDLAREQNMTAIPGALTPTEILTCLEKEARLVKVFPAHTVGPGYLRDLRTVMPGLEVMATGGIALTDGSISAWLKGGAVAVGVGSELGDATVDGAETVTRRAELALSEGAPGR
jgi:2-dehydro-3-deoxyphosphogluconate aldolase/(4S)-4-hydroxy-2-oxoglutarate aldolase